MKIWLVCIALVFGVFSPQEDYRSRIYRSYLRGDMEAWWILMDKMAADHARSPDPDLLYQLAETRYGYVAYCLSVKKKERAESVLELAEREIRSYLRVRPGDSKAVSLKGALFGYRVRLEPLKAPFYGRKSVEANEKAISLDPEEPRAWMEKANIEFYKPAIFGGSKERAVPLYEKAVRLYEASPGRIHENWVYLNCLVGLAMAYEETGRIRQAGVVYRKLLDIEPNFTWVRDELYPAYREKAFP